MELFVYFYPIINLFQYFKIIFWYLFPGVGSGYLYFRFRNKSFCIYPSFPYMLQYTLSLTSRFKFNILT